MSGELGGVASIPSPHVQGAASETKLRASKSSSILEHCPPNATAGAAAAGVGLGVGVGVWVGVGVDSVVAVGLGVGVVAICGAESVDVATTPPATAATSATATDPAIHAFR